MGRVFLAYGTPLAAVSLIQYLVQTHLSSEDNWPAVERNLQRERLKPGSLAKMLGKDGEDRRTAKIFYVTMVQAVLLFSSETWFLNHRLDKSLEGFCHWAERQMAGMGTKRQRYGT